MKNRNLVKNSTCRTTKIWPKNKILSKNHNFDGKYPRQNFIKQNFQKIENGIQNNKQFSLIFINFH